METSTASFCSNVQAPTSFDRVTYYWKLSNTRIRRTAVCQRVVVKQKWMMLPRIIRFALIRFVHFLDVKRQVQCSGFFFYLGARTKVKTRRCNFASVPLPRNICLVFSSLSGVHIHPDLYESNGIDCTRTRRSFALRIPFGVVKGTSERVLERWEVRPTSIRDGNNLYQLFMTTRRSIWNYNRPLVRQSRQIGSYGWSRARDRGRKCHFMNPKQRQTIRPRGRQECARYLLSMQTGYPDRNRTLLLFLREYNQVMLKAAVAALPPRHVAIISIWSDDNGNTFSAIVTARRFTSIFTSLLHLRQWTNESIIKEWCDMQKYVRTPNFHPSTKTST